MIAPLFKEKTIPGKMQQGVFYKGCSQSSIDFYGG